MQNKCQNFSSFITFARTLNTIKKMQVRTKSCYKSYYHSPTKSQHATHSPGIRLPPLESRHEYQIRVYENVYKNVRILLPQEAKSGCALLPIKQTHISSPNPH